MPANESEQTLVLAGNVSTNDSSELIPDVDESSWSKREFGDARLIFAVLPPPVIVVGVCANFILLVLTAIRAGGLQRHAVGFYVGGLCVGVAGPSNH